MKKLFSALFSIGFMAASFAQAVGINTTAPSEATVLHLEAQQYNSVNYGGFLMPVVTEAQQAAVPVSTIDNRDDGLMVFVSDPVTGKQCWEIYDSFQDVWRSISCSNDCEMELYSEDFESYAENTGITGASASNGDYPGGVTKWTLSSYSPSLDGSTAYPGILADANDYGLVIGGEFHMRDTNGPFLFQTETIDISDATSVSISFDVAAIGDTEYTQPHNGDFDCGIIENDYLDVEISTDGGATYNEVPNYNSEGNANHTIIFDNDKSMSVNLSGYSGTDLIIRLRSQTWAGSETIIIDNILVVCE